MRGTNFIFSATAGSCAGRVVARAGSLLAAVLAAPLHANPTTVQRDLAAAVATLPHAQTRAGVAVFDVTAGSPVFGVHPDEALTPASNTKVFVMAAALRELGPDFTFETRLAFDGHNLYLIGDGDPGLGDEKIHRARGETILAPFERFAEALKSRGVTQIPGDLVVDASIFDDQRLHPDWEPGDLGKWYAAPVAGIGYNDNCLDITVSPAGKGGGRTAVQVMPPTAQIRIVNLSKSAGKGDPVLHRPPGSNEYRISGTVTKRWTFSPVPVDDPVFFTGDVLRRVLGDRGVAVRGGVRVQRVRLVDGSLPPSMQVLATQRTPLSAVLARVGKDSQNYFAECLLKRIGYSWARRTAAGDAVGSWASGQRAVVAHLQAMGISTAGLVVADGSGLSRGNRCTARQLTTVLTAMAAQPGADLFRESLAEAGVDGSLRKRLRGLSASVYAKTGTMRGIRTLSGYVQSEDQRLYAFAVMFNGYSGPSTPYKEIQDRICRILAGEPVRNASR